MNGIYNYYRDKIILITGGLGFLGSNLAHKLVECEAKIIIIDNLNPLYGGNYFNINGIQNKIKIITDDVRKEKVLIPIIKQCDIIFHFAAQVSYIDSLSMPYEDLELNARATLQILEICRKYNSKVKIVFPSSRMVLGKIESSQISENSPTNPLSLYGIHKLTSEKYLIMYYKDFGIPFIIFRITNPYGPRQQIKHSKYSLVGWFIRQAMERKTIKIFGDGKQLRDYIFSDDIMEAICRCSTNEKATGEIINVASGKSTEFQEMVKEVVKIVKNGNYEFVSWPDNYEKIETGDVTANISKLQSLTHWKPKVTLSKGILKTYEYYKKYLMHYL